MKKNMGNTDRIVRMIAGIAFVLMAIFLTSGVLDVILYVFGSLWIVTSIAGICPLYIPFNISTKKK
jgi:uncharacterized membrane protein